MTGAHPSQGEAYARSRAIGSSRPRRWGAGHPGRLPIGTATTLIRYGGLTILTDPNFLHAGDHVGVMVTMDAKQGVQALRIIRPKKAIPIHYNDYGVFKSPLGDFKRAVEEAGLADRVVYLRHGETYGFRVPAAESLLSGPVSGS